MALLLGIGIVAAFLLLTAGHGGLGWRGPMMMHHHGPGPAPWIVFGLIGALLAVAFGGLIPLLVVFGGGYLIYRWLSGSNAPRVPSLNFRSQGPGGVPAPVEQGIFCPSCEQPVSRNWATCPNCGYRKYVAPDLIQRRCATCGTDLQKDWNACPYCSSRIDTPLLMPAPGPAQARPAPPAETATSV